jgi:hypothetical protein
MENLDNTKEYFEDIPATIKCNSWVYFVAPKENPNFFGLRKLFLDEGLATKYWKRCGTSIYTIWREPYYEL